MANPRTPTSCVAEALLEALVAGDALLETAFLKSVDRCLGAASKRQTIEELDALSGLLQGLPDLSAAERRLLLAPAIQRLLARVLSPELGGPVSGAS